MIPIWRDREHHKTEGVNGIRTMAEEIKTLEEAVMLNSSSTFNSNDFEVSFYKDKGPKVLNLVVHLRCLSIHLGLERIHTQRPRITHVKKANDVFKQQ